MRELLTTKTKRNSLLPVSRPMLSRPWPFPCYRQSMKRKPLPTSTGDFICMSNDLLSTCQRLLASARNEKRHGSSVPGPMECRRRLGRRRMTNAADAMQPTTHFFAALWGYAGEVDRTRWKWEAPTPRQQVTNDTSAWPFGPEIRSQPSPAVEDSPCLSHSDEDSLVTQPEEEIISKQTGIIAGRLTLLAHFRQSLQHFRSTISSHAPEWQMNGSMNAFIQCLEKSLASRCIRMRHLANILKSLRRDLRQRSNLLRKTSLNRDLWEEQFVDPIHRAIWQGLSQWPTTNAIKLLFPSMLPFISLPHTQRLATEMSSSLTEDRLQLLLPELGLLVSDWNYSNDKSWTLHVAKVEAALVRTNTILEQAREQISVAAQLNAGAIDSDLRSILNKAQAAVHLTGRLVGTAGLKVRANERSLRLLSKIFNTIPASSLPEILKICLARNEERSLNPRLKYRFLQIIASMESVDDKLFLDLSKYLFPRMQIEDDIVIDHMISQGYFQTLETMQRESLKACISTPNSTATRFACLINSTQDVDSGVNLTPSFLAMLLSTHRQRSLTKSLHEMLQLGLVVSHDLLTPLLMELAKRNALVAWEVFCAFQEAPQSCGADGRYSIRHCEGLMAAVINEPKFPLQLLWDTLEKEEVIKVDFSSSTTNLPSRKEFICKTAWVLARSEVRSNRVIIRHLEKCVQYFGNHRLLIPSSLVLALAHVSINRKVKDGQWVGRQPTRWVLDLMTVTRDRELAQRLAEVATTWRQHNRWPQRYKE